MPLDKNPGVRPIGIGETLRRLIAKVVLRITRQDIVEAAGALQTCAGQEGGAEAAAHALCRHFDSSNTEGALLVDATNAFNSLNRAAMLHNIHLLCPSIATISKNFYRSTVPLHVSGAVIWSAEGTTQGCPLAMPLYAIAITPLVTTLATAVMDDSPAGTVHDRESPERPAGVRASAARPDASTIQLWYADDAGAAGLLQRLRTWWDQICQLGPAFSYYPNAAKTWLVVKPEHLDAANVAFADTDVHITTEGRPYLGAPLGSEAFKTTFCNARVEAWASEMRELANVAEAEPQAVYAALVFGYRHRWTFLMRVSSCAPDVFEPLESSLRSVLLPALLGVPVVPAPLRSLLALPVRHGGLAVLNPVEAAPQQRTASLSITSSLQQLIADQSSLYSVDPAAICAAKAAAKQAQSVTTKTVLQTAGPEALPPMLLEHLQAKGTGAWLTCLLVREHGYSLDRRSFVDALCIRYGLTIHGSPTECPCGRPFTIDHAMICKLGGYPIHWHNHVRNYLGQLLSQVSEDVQLEPPLQPLPTVRTFDHGPALLTADDARPDIKARGFWSVQTDAFFDVRVFYPNAQSYRSRPLAEVFQWHERQKQSACGARIREVEHASFTPIVLSSAGALAKEATRFLKLLGTKLSTKLSQPYPLVMGKLRTDLAFSLVRDSVLMVRGSCRAFRAPGLAADVDAVSVEARIPATT